MRRVKRLGKYVPPPPKKEEPVDNRAWDRRRAISPRGHAVNITEVERQFLFDVLRKLNRLPENFFAGNVPAVLGADCIFQREFRLRMVAIIDEGLQKGFGVNGLRNHIQRVLGLEKPLETRWSGRVLPRWEHF